MRNQLIMIKKKKHPNDILIQQFLKKHNLNPKGQNGVKFLIMAGKKIKESSH
jgi:hypothetical protein